MSCISINNLISNNYTSIDEETECRRENCRFE